MSDSIFAKIRLITLGNLHELMNKMIDLNSVAAVKQYIRDLENALDELKGQAAEAEGRKRFVVVEQGKKVGEKTGIESSIKALLTDGNPNNDHLTTAMAVRVVALQKTIGAFDGQVEEATRSDQLIDTAVSQLGAKVAAMKAQLEELQSLEAASKAKEKAAAGLSAAAAVLGQGENVSIDNVAARIRERAQTADAKLEQAMGAMNTSVDDDVQLGEAAAYLEQLKASLGTKEEPKAETYEVTVERTS